MYNPGLFQYGNDEAKFIIFSSPFILRYRSYDTFPCSFVFTPMIRNLSYAGLFLACLSFVSADKCSQGHATCISFVGPSSWCKLESNTCHGNPAIECHCAAARHSASLVEHAPPVREESASMSASAAGLYGDEVCISRVGPSSWCRVEDGTCQGDSSISCTAVPPASPSGSRVTKGHDGGIFLWVEWPTLEASEWGSFFDSVLDFIESNCGEFRVSRVIIRVLSPEFQSDRGRLWQVGTESAFYQRFLTRLPKSVEIMIYPYLLDKSSADEWRETMGVSAPLEAVYKYVSQWNELLALNRVETRIAGVVTDKEEGRNFLTSLPMIPAYRSRYTIAGQAPLRFGLAIGYDHPGSMHSISTHIDDFYLEMYDFYHDRIVPVVNVEASTPGLLNNPKALLAKLDSHVWGPYLSRYDSHKAHFMWSLQIRSGAACIMPSSEGTCGQMNDFGGWDVKAAKQFFALIAEKYPAFAKRPMGFFQFSYTPKRWATCS